MNASLKNLFAAVLLSGAGSAMAASSVDLTVTGLITPSSCEPSLSSGGVYDMGKISAKDLNVDMPTSFPVTTLQLTVTCDAATLMALEAKDNREGSDFNNDTMAFGLGLVNGNEKLGSVELRLLSPIVDGAPARAIGSTDGGTVWERDTNFMRGNILSVADNTTDAPIPVQTLTSELALYPKIAPARTLTLTNEVAIDGSVTLTVKYL
ncbi:MULTISPECIES: DUF1120 domain-containing protein [Pseudomonas]|uniref:DUF1120 domain-containing protein n=1 Tax=Pseudomonas azadiae TaxID=2843612 RepID=A0ABS6NS78_9PSED|nr:MULTISPECIES: DUF1120 domain-containing protein [Pseudomonas]MBV4451071.1 DUF1120 domain-containing protein [Pseudomonas azadiae]NMF40308.1 DUF1120 domain-containing protein [Pseudomonas sp. SWRI 103]